MAYGLSRTTKPLLRTVNNRPHARPEDHHDEAAPSEREPYPTPPSTYSSYGSQPQHNIPPDEEDFNRDPESSGDEQACESQVESKMDQVEDASLNGEKPRPSGFHVRSSTVLDRPASRQSPKRNAASPDEDDFFKPPKAKRQAKSYSKKTFLNIHARSPVKSKSSRDAMVGRDKSRRKQREVDAPARPQFQERTTDVPMETKERTTDVPMETKKKPSFQHRVVDLQSLTTVEVEDEADDSSDLSSVPEELDEPGKVLCSICRDQVDAAVKEDFDDTINHKKRTTYRWQQRFCLYHRRREAELVWLERGYPEIDWVRLSRRLRKYDSQLSRVLNNEVTSRHRSNLESRLKSGPKSLRQMERSAEAPKSSGAMVGYYGPRGEKLMTEHIVSRLSDEIRECATRDHLVAAAGVQGGVSGFVQAVLVPHLAELLVKEDFDLRQNDWQTRAGEILTESAPLGDLMHSEMEEQILDVEE